MYLENGLFFSKCNYSEDLLSTLPYIYFTDQHRECLVENAFCGERFIFSNIVLFFDELKSISFKNLWYETINSAVKRGTKYSFCCLNFESLNLIGKVQTVMVLINHLANYNVETDCLLDSCCELIETEIYEAELLAIFTSIIYYLPHLNLIEGFVTGYISHSVQINLKFLRKLSIIFCSEWLSLINHWLLKPTVSFFKGLHEIVNVDNKEKICFRVQKIVYDFLTIHPQHLISIIDSCIANYCFPGLVLDLILDMRKDDFFPIIFLKRILLDSVSETRIWMFNFLKKDSSSHYLEKLTNYFIFVTKIINTSDCLFLNDDLMIKGLTLLRVLVALNGFVGYNFVPELSCELIKILTHRTIISNCSSLYISYCLAFFIGLCSSLSGLQDIDNTLDANLRLNVGNTYILSNVENTIIDWLQRLIDEQESYYLTSVKEGNQNANNYQTIPSYIELLLLLAILFYTNQSSLVTDLISNSLGLRISSLGRTINGWRKLLLQTVFTENMIVYQIARIPVVPNLNSNSVDQLPMQCLLQLFKSHAFVKNRLKTKDWIVKQINQSIRPLHPLMSDLLEAHIAHLFGLNASAQISKQFQVDVSDLISESELIKYFSENTSNFIRLCAPCNMTCINSPTQRTLHNCEDNDNLSFGDDLTPQLLFFYYALYVYDYQLMDNWRRQSTESWFLPICVYSDKLWDVIPITYLLRYARNHLFDYRTLYPKLLQLVTNHFPHLTIGEMLILDELLLDPLWTFNKVDTLNFGVECTTLKCNANFNSTKDCYTNEFLRIGIPNVIPPSPEQLNEAFDNVLNDMDTNMFLVGTKHTCGIQFSFYWKILIRLVDYLSTLNRDDSNSVRRLMAFGTVLAEKCPQLLLKIDRNLLLTTNRRFVHQLELLWRRLRLIMPRRLELVTINKLTNIEKTNSSLHFNSTDKNITGLDICTDPIENLLTKVDEAVFRCPSVLRLFIRILESSLLASRLYWSHRLINRPVLSSLLSSSANNSTNSDSSLSNPSFLTTTSSNICVTNSHLLLNSQTTGVNNDCQLSNIEELNTNIPIDIVSSQSLMNLNDPSHEHSKFKRIKISHLNTINNAAANAEDCEWLCANMLLTQGSTVVQILLEYCLFTEDEKLVGSELSVLRETRNIVCNFIHSLFIAEPSLAEIVVWQTYSQKLIPMSVQAIPSLHICLDTVLDVYRMNGDYSKMIFCFDVVSHLAQHYNIQITWDRAAFMIDSFYHILTSVVDLNEKCRLLHACLPSFVRLGSVLPKLAPVISRILLFVGIQLGRSIPEEQRLIVCAKAKTLDVKDSTYKIFNERTNEEQTMHCILKIMNSFDELVRQASAQQLLYYSPDD